MTLNRIAIKYLLLRNMPMLITMSVILIVLASGIWFLAKNVAQKEARVTELENARIIAEHHRLQTRRAETLLNARQNDLASMQRLLIKRNAPVPFIEALESMGEHTGNKVLFSVAEEETNEDTLTFRATINGTAASVRAFLRAIETAPYLIEITELTFERTEKEAPDARTTLLLKLRVQTAK